MPIKGLKYCCWKYYCDVFSKIYIFCNAQHKKTFNWLEEESDLYKMILNVFWFSSMCSYWNASIPGPAGESVPVYYQTSEFYLKNIHISYLFYLLLFMSCKKLCTFSVEFMHIYFNPKHCTTLWVIKMQTSVKKSIRKVPSY